MTYYYREDFEPQASKGLLVFVGIVISVCSLLVGAGIGFEIRDWLQRESEAQAKAMPKPRPIVQNPPPNLIPCNDPLRSRELVSQICRARKNAI